MPQKKDPNLVEASRFVLSYCKGFPCENPLALSLG
jgi:hypothetical protein